MTPPLRNGWDAWIAYELGWAKEKSVSVDLDAPLSQWDIENSFDSAAECRNEKARLVFDGRTKIQILNDRDLHADCIASDDPRLKEK
jgi:hypothetical protein